MQILLAAATVLLLVSPPADCRNRPARSGDIVVTTAMTDITRSKHARVVVLDGETGAVRANISTSFSPAGTAAVSPDGKLLFATMAGVESTGEVSLVRIAGGKLREELHMAVGGLQPEGVQFGSADGFAVSQSNRLGATLHFAYAPGSKGCARFAAKHLYLATVRYNSAEGTLRRTKLAQVHSLKRCPNPGGGHRIATVRAIDGKAYYVLLTTKRAVLHSLGRDGRPSRALATMRVSGCGTFAIESTSSFVATCYNGGPIASMTVLRRTGGSLGTKHKSLPGSPGRIFQGGLSARPGPLLAVTNEGSLHQFVAGASQIQAFSRDGLMPMRTIAILPPDVAALDVRVVP